MALASKVAIPSRKPVEAVALEIPRPLSMNGLWRTTTTGNWYLSKEYKAWKEEVGLIANANRVGCVNGPFAVTIKVKAKWRGDIDNIAKSTLDTFQQLGIIQNDKLAQRILIERSDATPGMSVLIVSTREAAE